MNRCNSYTDSGIEWLGEIPTEWQVVRLRYLCDISTGDKDTINREDDGKYPFYVRSKKIERISTFGYDEEAILTPGDGDICKIWHYVNGKFECHQRVYKLSNFKINGRFLYYYLMSNFENDVFKLSAKSTVDSLRRPMFQNFAVAFGSALEQEAIANFLDRKTSEIDTLIEKKKQLIALLKEERTAIINHAVTKGINPDVKYRDSGIDWIGEIPEHWNYSKLKYYTTSKTGSTPSRDKDEYWQDGTIPWMSSGEINQKFIYNIKGRITEAGYKKSSVSLLPVNTVMIAMNGQGKTKGTVGVLKVESTCNQSLTGFITDEEHLHYLFLYYFLESKYKNLRGLVGEDREGLSSVVLRNIYIPIPPVDEQQAIAHYLTSNNNAIDSTIDKIEKEIELMQEYKTALISEVVTGKVDVREEIMDMVL